MISSNSANKDRVIKFKCTYLTQQRIGMGMVFQLMSWACTWWRVGWLSTNWRLRLRQKRKNLPRSHIHPIQACAPPAPACVPCFNSSPSFFCTWGRLPFRDFPAPTHWIVDTSAAVGQQTQGHRLFTLVLICKASSWQNIWCYSDDPSQ